MGFADRLVRLTAFITLTLTRWILPVLIWLMVRMIVLEIASAVALIRGVPATVDLIEEDWSQQVSRTGLDSRLDRVARRLIRVMAYVSLGLGWVLMAASTMAVVYLMISLF